MSRSNWIETCRVPAGPTGGDGAVVKKDPQKNVSGQKGKVDIHDSNADSVANLVASAPSLLYLQSALRAAEVSYANAAYDDALDQLTWLGRLLIHPQITRTSRESVYDFGLDPVEPAVEGEAVRRKVFTLIHRMVLGLDYWGNTHDFVPLLNQRAYSEALDNLLEHARKIELASIRYRDAGDKWTEARNSFSEAIVTHEGFIQSLGDQFQELAKIEFALVNDIENLTNSYEPSWRLVLQAGDDFKDAVRRETGCDFIDVVVAVGAIGTAIGTMGTGASAAIAAWQTYNQFNAKKDDPEDKLGNLAEDKYKIDKIVSIGKGVAQVAKGIGSLADILDQPNTIAPKLPSDAAKMIMSRQDLEATIEPFRHLPEATAYLDQVEEFIELATTRNNKIIEYNQLANVRAEARADIDAAESEISRLRAEINRPNVRHLPEFTSYMARANMMNKRVIMQTLYKQHRALEYWSGEIFPFSIQRDSIEHLSNTHNQTKIRLINAMENRGREVQHFVFADNIARFSIAEDIGDRFLKSFRQTGQLVFSLPLDSFVDMALVRVNHVRISLPGVSVNLGERGNDPFGVRLTHFGSASLTTLSDSVLEFHHEPRHTVLFYHVEKQMTRAFHLGGSDTFLKLTPEGPWGLFILEPEMNRVILDGLKDIIFEFEGEFLPIG